MPLLTVPPGLHRDDYLHEGESAAQWVANCERRNAKKAVRTALRLRTVYVHHLPQRLRENSDHYREHHPPETPPPLYGAGAILEEKQLGDPDFDKKTDVYERIVQANPEYNCCPCKGSCWRQPAGGCPCMAKHDR